MRIALRRRRLLVTEQLSDEQQRKATGCTDARIRVAKIMKAHVVETRAGRSYRQFLQHRESAGTTGDARGGRSGRHCHMKLALAQAGVAFTNGKRPGGEINRLKLQPELQPGQGQVFCGVPYRGLENLGL
jgi:hypothetical protein